MSRRGARVLFFAIMGLTGAVMCGFAMPVRLEKAPLAWSEIVPLARLCQGKPADEIDYKKFFTAPERDKKIIHVFYNNIIETADEEQFGYALLYGLEYAAEMAEEDDSLAVGLYFSGSKGTIYLIDKKKYMELRKKNLTAEILLKHMWVAKGKIGPGTTQK